MTSGSKKMVFKQASGWLLKAAKTPKPIFKEESNRGEGHYLRWRDDSEFTDRKGWGFFSFYNGHLKSNKRTFIFLSLIRCLREESNLSPASKPKLKETDQDVFLAFISALCRQVFQRHVISFFSNENKKRL